MFEEELVELTGSFEGGGRTLDFGHSRGWSLVTAVMDMESNRLLGCLRMEGSGTDAGEVAVEFEEALAAA